MQHRISIYAGIAATIGAALVWALPAGADTSTVPPGQQTCPGPGGVDPDTMTLSDAANMWPPNGRSTTYTLTGAETTSEQSGDPAPHYVTIDYRVTASPSGDVVASGSSPNNLNDNPSDNNSSASLSFRLRATSLGNSRPWVYVISWDAAFDGGVHTCHSSDSGEHAFAVTVSPS